MTATPAAISLVTLEPFTVACVKHVSADPMPTARDAILTWAASRDVMLPDGRQVLGYNDFMKGPHNGYIVCVPVPAGTEGDGDVFIEQHDGGDYLMVTPQPSIMDAWHANKPLFKPWLAEHGYVNQDLQRQCFELHFPQTQNLSALMALPADERWVGYSVLIPVGRVASK